MGGRRYESIDIMRRDWRDWRDWEGEGRGGGEEVGGGVEEAGGGWAPEGESWEAECSWVEGGGKAGERGEGGGEGGGEGDGLGACVSMVRGVDIRGQDFLFGRGVGGRGRREAGGARQPGWEGCRLTGRGVDGSDSWGGQKEGRWGGGGDNRWDGGQSR